jgi:hypothetical protein
MVHMTIDQSEGSETRMRFRETAHAILDKSSSPKSD